MASRVSFRWLLTLLALVAPAALDPCRAGAESDPASTPQQTSSDVVFRHYL